jgi:hypothetical protein
MSTIRQFPVNGLFGLTRDQSVQFKPDLLNLQAVQAEGEGLIERPERPNCIEVLGCLIGLNICFRIF